MLYAFSIPANSGKRRRNLPAKKTAEAAFELQSVLYFFSSSEEATFSLGAFFFRYSK